MTACEAHDLQLFLETGRDGHCDELAVGALHGNKIGDAVHNTIIALRDALGKR